MSGIEDSLEKESRSVLTVIVVVVVRNTSLLHHYKIFSRRLMAETRDVKSTQ